MSSAGWFPRTLSALLIVASGYHVWGLRTAFRGCRSGLDVDLAHALMAVVMAWMLVAPVHGRVAMWLLVAFALGAAWFAAAAVRRYVLEGRGRLAQRAGHVVGCAAMAYMLVPMSAMSMSGVASAWGHWWVVTDLLLVGVSTVAVWTLRRVWARRGARTRSQATGRSGLVAAGCQLAVSTATAYLLACLL